MSNPSTSIGLFGPAALRALARAFGDFGEFDRLVQGLQAALGHSEHFDRLTIQIDAAVADASGLFLPGALTMPLGGGRGPLGSLQIGSVGRPRKFGAEDLHLMAGLADFISAVLAQSVNFRELAGRETLVRFLLNQAPVGIAAYDSERRLIVANDLAARWIEEAGLPFNSWSGSDGGFHIRASGKLIYGEARQSAEDAAGSWMVVLHDLTPEQARLLEQLQCETYRKLSQGGHLAFALIEGAQVKGGVLRRLAHLRESLLEGEIAGPYDAHRIGIILPEMSGLALRARLRRLRNVFVDTDNLRLGYAELGRDGRTPELLLEKALQRVGEYDEMLRPILLVHDDSAAVADAFAMVLGKEFQVVKSTSPGRTRELLATEPFEGFVTEMELRNGVSGMELVRYAREKQPGIKPFFTTVQRAPYGLPAGATEEDALVLEKPFDVDLLTQIVRSNLLN